MNKISGFFNDHRAIVAPLLIVILVGAILLATFSQTRKEVTIEDYNHIEVGMTYENVLSVLGEGKEMKDVPGLDKIDANMYEWNNPDGTGMNMLIKDGLVNSKYEYGLE